MIVDWAEKYGSESMVFVYLSLYFGSEFLQEFASAARSLGWVGANGIECHNMPWHLTGYDETGGVVPPAMNPSIAQGYIGKLPWFNGLAMLTRCDRTISHCALYSTIRR